MIKHVAISAEEAFISLEDLEAILTQFFKPFSKQDYLAILQHWMLKFLATKTRDHFLLRNFGGSIDLS